MEPSYDDQFYKLPPELHAHLLEQSDPATRIATRLATKGLLSSGINNVTWYNLIREEFDEKIPYNETVNYKNYYYYLKEALNVDESHRWFSFSEYDYSTYDASINYEIQYIKNHHWHEQLVSLQYHADGAHVDSYDIVYLPTIDYRKMYYMRQLFNLFNNIFSSSMLPYSPSKAYMTIKYGIANQNSLLSSAFIYKQTDFETLYNAFLEYLRSRKILDLMVVDFIITKELLDLFTILGQQIQPGDINNIDQKLPKVILETRAVSYAHFSLIIDTVKNVRSDLLRETKYNNKFYLTVMSLLQKRNFYNAFFK
jgi:hypothetical protein